MPDSRIVLRRPSDSDAEAIFSGWARDPSTTRHLSWPTHTSLDDTRAFLAGSDEEWRRWGCGPLLITLAGTGSVIGTTGLRFYSATRAEIGYVLGHAYWGCGYATEAVSAVVAIAPGLGLNRLQAGVHPDNAASRRVLEKCGFKLEATSHETVRFPNLPGTPEVRVAMYARTLSADEARRPG